jgi:7 transmembrane receptor (rhodopsin family)
VGLTSFRAFGSDFFSFADLLVGLLNVLTDIIWRLTVSWRAGNIACKVIRFVEVTVTYSSTFVLVSLSIDRFDAICYPLNFAASCKYYFCRSYDDITYTCAYFHGDLDVLSPIIELLYCAWPFRKLFTQDYGGYQYHLTCVQQWEQNIVWDCLFVHFLLDNEVVRDEKKNWFLQQIWSEKKRYIAICSAVMFLLVRYGNGNMLVDHIREQRCHTNTWWKGVLKQNFYSFTVYSQQQENKETDRLRIDRQQNDLKRANFLKCALKII